MDEQLLDGRGKRDEQFILLLNIEAVFNSNDLEIAEKSAQQGEVVEQVLEEQPVSFLRSPCNREN